jgi:hypothetical protein
VHPAVHSIKEVVHDDRNWTCTPFSSLFTEPIRKKRKIDEWILSFPRHQNNDPPLSGPFACWRRRSVHVQAHTLAGDPIPANPGTCESCSVGAAAAGALSYQLNQISGSRLLSYVVETCSSAEKPTVWWRATPRESAPSAESDFVN